MLTTFREDLYRKAGLYGLPRAPRSLLRMCFTEATTAQVIYRLMQACQRRRALRPLALALCRLNAHLSSALIGRGAEFGPGFVLLHSFGVVVNSAVRAGRDLTLQHGVTIGEEKGRSPVLGDNVFVGAGAKILGGVRVGSDVKVGANAVVVTDLPDGATAVGVPARVVRIYGERVARAGCDSCASGDAARDADLLELANL